MARRKVAGGPGVVVEQAIALSTATRKLESGWDYLVIISGDQGFLAVFDGSAYTKNAVLEAVYTPSFQKRLEDRALVLGETLTVEVVGKKTWQAIDSLADFALHHETPSQVLLVAEYDEGDIHRALSQVS
jgi:hypothetical protein